MHFLIVHGSYGHPQENWFPWLKAELEKEGHTADVPAFPTPEGQTWNNWYPMAKEALKDHKLGDTILIGHSIGAAFVLRLAERTAFPFRAVFAVCPFMHELGLEMFDVLNTTFIRPEPNWNDVKAGAKHIVCIAGDDDPYVPLAMPRKIAEKAGAEMVEIPNGGHLNAEAGCTKFPLLLNRLLSLT